MLCALLQDEYADSRALEVYRRRRVEQLRLTALRNRFGRVYPLRRDEFSREVTEASCEGMPEKDKAKGRGGAGGRGDEDDEAAEGYAAAGSRAASSVGGGAGSAAAPAGEGEGGVYVVVLLYKAGIPDSRLMEDLFARVAEKHKVCGVQVLASLMLMLMHRVQFSCARRAHAQSVRVLRPSSPCDDRCLSASLPLSLSLSRCRPPSS